MSVRTHRSESEKPKPQMREPKAKKEKKEKKEKELSPEERARITLKREVAMALGLWDKVEQIGWGGLSAAETGRIGAALQRRLREANPSA
ncbi:MAG: small, acid-soluble spore protein, alpha/beta type [Clostridia bacterium]